MGAFDMVVIHKDQQVVGKLADGKGTGASWGLSVTTGVKSVHMVVLGKHIDLVVKIGMVLSVAVKQNEGITLTFLYIEMCDVHHRQGGVLLLLPGKGHDEAGVGGARRVELDITAQTTGQAACDGQADTSAVVVLV